MPKEGNRFELQAKPSESRTFMRFLSLNFSRRFPLLNGLHKYFISNHNVFSFASMRRVLHAFLPKAGPFFVFSYKGHMQFWDGEIEVL